MEANGEHIPAKAMCVRVKEEDIFQAVLDWEEDFEGKEQGEEKEGNEN